MQKNNTPEVLGICEIQREGDTIKIVPKDKQTRKILTEIIEKNSHHFSMEISAVES